MHARIHKTAFALFLSLILIGAGCESSTSGSTTQQPVTPPTTSTEPEAAPVTPEPANPLAAQQPTGDLHKVLRVVDGDTIDIDLNGTTERVRLIGINTPETVDPRKTVECFGREASAQAKKLLEGQSVRIEADASQDDRDKYGRLLRYVFFSDGRNFSLLMIRDGYANEYTYEVPYKYQTEFNAAEEEAKAAKRGLWADATCAGQTDEPAPTPTPTTTTPAPSAAQDCVIKGNISSEKIYHLPGCGSYNSTVIDESKGERWFCTEVEAIEAGWRKAKNC